ncbi:MAG: class I SAM-dependent methyltransferase [Candidatus Eisenbacteria bacterium]
MNIQAATKPTRSETEDAFWDARWAGGHMIHVNEREKLEGILTMIPETLGTLLDVGCGTGWMLEALRPRCDYMVGLDSSLQGLGRASGTGDAVAGSGIHLPFRDGTFDLVLCAEVLEHYRDDVLDEAAAELARVSKRSVLVTVPFEENLVMNTVRCDNCSTEFHSSLHMRSFSAQDLVRLFEPHGLTAAAVRKTGNRPYRSEWIVRMNAALTGYRAFWRRGLRCPRCGNTEFRCRRARENPVSLVLEGMNRILSRLLPSQPHNLCVLLEKDQG